MDRSVDTAVPIAGAETARSLIQDIPDLAASVADAQSGNPDAFRVLYRDIHPRLLRYLHALVGDDAEDVASEAWLHVARDLHAFNGDYDGFRGWVTTIARHRALDHLRRHSRRAPSIPVPVEELADLAAMDDTAACALETVSTDAAVRLIATLPSDQAEAVLLRAVVAVADAHHLAGLGAVADPDRAAHRGTQRAAGIGPVPAAGALGLTGNNVFGRDGNHLGAVPPALARGLDAAAIPRDSRCSPGTGLRHRAEDDTGEMTPGPVTRGCFPGVSSVEPGC